MNSAVKQFLKFLAFSQMIHISMFNVYDNHNQECLNPSILYI